MIITATMNDIIFNFIVEFNTTIKIFSIGIMNFVAMATILLEMSIATVVAMGNYHDTDRHRSKKPVHFK